MAASLQEGQVLSTALGDYVLVATPGTGGDCGYYATLQSLAYLTESTHLRKSEMLESVRRGLEAAHESQGATINWLRADQIAQYLHSIGVQLFVVVEGRGSLANSQGFIAAPSVSPCADWPVLVLVNEGNFHWWATRPSTSGNQATPWRVLPSIVQPAFVEPFEDPRQVIKGKLSQWVLKTYTIAKASYQGPNTMRYDEFLDAYEDMAISTTALTQKFFCAICINMPYLGNWARLVRYNGHKEYRPYEEWAIHCLARDLYAMRSGETPSLMTGNTAAYEPELYELVIAQATIRDRAHRSRMLQQPHAVTLPEAPRRLPEVWSLTVSRLSNFNLEGWQIQDGADRSEIQEFAKYPIAFTTASLFNAYKRIIQTHLLGFGTKIHFLQATDLRQEVSLASIRDALGQSRITSFDHVFVPIFAVEFIGQVSKVRELVYTSKPHTELHRVVFPAYEEDDTGLVVLLQLLLKLSLGLRAVHLTNDLAYAQSLKVRITNSMMAAVMAGKLLPTVADFQRCMSRGYFG